MTTPLRQRAEDLFNPPFRYHHGYIFDADDHMVSDDGGIARLRGWGRIAYMGDSAALQDEVGRMIADALNQYYELKEIAP